MGVASSRMMSAPTTWHQTSRDALMLLWKDFLKVCLAQNLACNGKTSQLIRASKQTSLPPSSPNVSHTYDVHGVAENQPLMEYFQKKRAAVIKPLIIRITQCSWIVRMAINDCHWRAVVTNHVKMCCHLRPKGSFLTLLEAVLWQLLLIYLWEVSEVQAYLSCWSCCTWHIMPAFEKDTIPTCEVCLNHLHSFTLAPLQPNINLGTFPNHRHLNRTAFCQDNLYISSTLLLLWYCTGGQYAVSSFLFVRFSM